MDYLGGEALCSVPAMFVIARLLHAGNRPYEYGELQRTLGLGGGVVDDQDDAVPNASGVLAASLKVGADLELVSQTRPRTWVLHDSMGEESAALTQESTESFRDLVLRRLGRRALTGLSEKAGPADVARASVWLLLQDMDKTMSAAWASPKSSTADSSMDAERVFDAAGMRSVVVNSTQFRSFLRWFRALGLGCLSGSEGDTKTRIIVDPTPAIARSLHRLPREAPAAEWIERLTEEYPVIGHRDLVASLPTGSYPDHQTVPPSLSLALFKMRQQGRIDMRPGADHRGAVTLGLAGTKERVADITVKG